MHETAAAVVSILRSCRSDPGGAASGRVEEAGALLAGHAQERAGGGGRVLEDLLRAFGGEAAVSPEDLSLLHAAAFHAGRLLGGEEYAARVEGARGLAGDCARAGGVASAAPPVRGASAVAASGLCVGILSEGVGGADPRDEALVDPLAAVVVQSATQVLEAGGGDGDAAWRQGATLAVVWMLEGGGVAAQLQAEPSILHCLLRCFAVDLIGSAVRELRLGCARGEPPAQVCGRVGKMQAGLLWTAAPGLVRAAAGLCAELPPCRVPEAVGALRSAAGDFFEEYRGYTLAAFPGWLAGVDGVVVKRLLDVQFVSMVTLLHASTGRPLADPNPPPEAAAAALDTLALLEFCRQPLGIYGETLQRALRWVVGRPAAAAETIRCLPVYADLVAPLPATRPQQHPGGECWAADPLEGARVYFYLRMLPALVPALPAGAALERVAPVALLFILHPREAAATAAHAVVRALLLHGNLGGGGGGGAEERERLVPFYLRRALGAFPGPTPFKALVAGYAAVAREMPPGSPVVPWSLHLLSERARELEGGGAGGGGGGGGEEAAPPSDQLAELLFNLLPIVSLQWLPEALSEAEGLLLTAPRRVVVLQKALGACSDCVRQQHLVRWYQGTARSTAERASSNAL